MINMMKKLACALVALAFAVPTYADNTCSASLNLKTCVSTLDNVTFSGGVLTATGKIRALNSGGTDGTIVNVVANLQVKDGSGAFQTIMPPGAVVSITLVGSFTAAGGGDGLCGGPDTAGLTYTATFSGPAVSSLASGTPARIELLVTYSGATPTVSPGVCSLRTPAVRFGLVVP